MKNQTLERGIIASDIHIPFEDKDAVKVFLSFMKWYKPQMLFLNGDILDFWSVSSHDKHPKDSVALREEFTQGRAFLEECKKRMARGGEIFYIFGNHEFRFERYMIDKARDLYGLDGLSIEAQMGLEELGIQVVNTQHKENYIQWGDLFIGHWGKAASQGAYAAKSLIDNKMVSIAQGHTHKFGMTTRKGLDGKIYKGIEYGCLCDTDPSWIKKPNWMHGFCVVERDRNTGETFPTPIFLQGDDKRFTFGGKLWSV